MVSHRREGPRRRCPETGPLTVFGLLQLMFGRRIAGRPYQSAGEVAAAWKAHGPEVLARWRFSHPPFGQWVAENASEDDDLGELERHWRASSRRQQYGDGQTDPWPPKPEAAS